MVELLSPAGNFEKMVAAFRYGADAVYIAGKKFGMRAQADNFTIDEIDEAIKYAHNIGRKIYVTINIMPKTSMYSELKEYMHSLAKLKNGIVDGYIISDPGVFMLAKEILKGSELHVSTQAGCVSAEDCMFWYSLGASRVVLARELSLEDIKEIRHSIPKELEIETFVHGSMCVSFSGRCLLSSYLTGRDGNLGECAQPCRWNFTIQEQTRPNDFLPIEQTDLGTFIMSSKDMNMSHHIPDLIESGISSLKIEGRMKSAYYTAVVTNVYRSNIDAYLKDKEHYVFDERWQRELDSVSHREYCTGYYYDNPMQNPQLCTEPGYMKDKAYLAVAVGYDKEKGLAKFIQKNKLSKGTVCELVSPGKFGQRIDVETIYSDKYEIIESTPHPFMEFYIPTNIEVKEGDILRSGN